MNRIQLGHWFVTDNKLSISLLRYCIDITICYNDMFVFYRLMVTDENNDTLIFNFYSLEDAMMFTEKTISTCITLKDIVKSYQEQFKCFKSIKKAMIKK